MNANAMTLPPTAAPAASTANGKTADPAAPDVPFRQVFSGELARKAADSEDAEAALIGDALPVMLADPAVRPDLALVDAAALASTETAPGAEMLMAIAAAADGLPREPLPQTPLAVAVASVAAPVCTPALTAAAPIEAPTPATSASPAAAAIALQDTRETPTAALRSLPAPSEGHAPAAAPAPEATVLADRLAAARQSDPGAASERVADLMSHPGLRLAAHAAAPASPTPLAPSEPRLAPSVGTAAWGQALGERLVWMASGAQQTASLTLNPPHLGPLQVVLSVSNDQATANFFAAQPEVRQAIETAFPKLREMMNEAGIQLGQATVSAETPRQQEMPERQAQSLPFGTRDGIRDDAESAVPMAAPVRQAGRGLVDTFA